MYNEKLRKKARWFVIAALASMAAYFLILIYPVQDYYVAHRTSPGWFVMLIVAVFAGMWLAYLSYASFVNRINADTGYSGNIDTSMKKITKVKYFAKWWIGWSVGLYIMNLIWLAEL